MFLLLAEEHVARLKAEAEAQDHRNRLRVAQEQLAEYAAQKQQDAADVLSQADALQAALTALLQQAGDSPQVSSAAEALTRLKERLEDVAEEAEAFAKQQVIPHLLHGAMLNCCCCCYCCCCSRTGAS